MNSMTQAYITGVGAYLPGDPVDNQELADRFGDGTARDAALRQRALAANGIWTRHYAVNSEGLTVRRNRARPCDARPGRSAAEPAAGTRRSNSASRWSERLGIPAHPG